MLARMAPRTSLRVLGGVALAVGAARAGVPRSDGKSTAITIWAGAPTTPAYGGVAYGGSTPTTGALVTEHRTVDVAGGEVRLVGVPATVDAASVHLRDQANPDGLAVVEQRFQPGARTPAELLAHGIGGPVTVVTTKGEVTGTLRAADEQSLVVEIAAGLQVLRRDGYVLDVKLGGGATIHDLDKPSLIWRVTAKQPGPHAIEVTYRADGLAWSADYLAILDDTGANLDFSAVASIKNATTAAFDDAEVTLVTGATMLAAGSLAPTAATARSTTTRYLVPAPVHLGAGEVVQVELIAPRTNVKARTVVGYEAMADQSENYQEFANTDCTQGNGAGVPAGSAQVAVELDLPTGTSLPPGRVRVFQRSGKHVDVIGDDQLRIVDNVARIRVSPDAEITGERHATACDYDEQARTLREKVTVTITSKAKKPLDVAVREYMWRASMYRLEEPHWKRPVSGQAEEKRLHLAPGGKATWSYSVAYTWN